MRLTTTGPPVEVGTPGTRSTGVCSLWHAVLPPLIASLMASPVLLCAERIADLIAGLASTGTKCIGLGERIVSLINVLSPIVLLGAEILETSFVTSALDKLQTLLISIDMFLRTALHLLSDGFEVELEARSRSSYPGLTFTLTKSRLSKTAAASSYDKKMSFIILSNSSMSRILRFRICMMTGH
jgi:hypothetical protein